MVNRYHFRIVADPRVVSNGDGSQQISPGFVTVTFQIGLRFKARAQLRVINLDRFDMIIGMDLIRNYKIEMRWDPFRLEAPAQDGSNLPPDPQPKSSPPNSCHLQAIMPGSSSRKLERVCLPICVVESSDQDGNDTSAYCVTAEEFQLTTKALGYDNDEVLAVIPGNDNILRYHSLRAELSSLFNSSSDAEDFREKCHDFLANLKSTNQTDFTSSPGEGTSGFIAPSVHAHAEKEQQFRRFLTKKYPDLCADTLPENGPQAKWPDGTQPEIRLRLKEGKFPQSRRQFRIPEAQREHLTKTINELLQYKLIQPSLSPYSNPVFLVPKPPKKDGSPGGWRFVWDGRSVNQAIESDAYLIPRVEDLIDRIARVKHEAARKGITEMWISTIDLRTSFWQLKLHEDSRPLTAFSTSAGTFEWTVLPMGLLVSSAHLQRWIEAVLRPFSGTTFEYVEEKKGAPSGLLRRGFGCATPYIDDTAVISFGLRDEHERLLTMVLDALNRADARIQPGKCEFFRARADFLGHTLSATGISQQDSKVAAINNWPPLTDLKSVRSFVSLCSYYRKFIKDFAKIAQPLTDLMKSDGWRTPDFPEALQAVANLKQAITTAPVLAYFNVKAKTDLYVDASGLSIGGVLQQDDENGDSRPVGFYSRRLQGAEVTYSTYDRELLGLRDSVLHFRHLLLGIPFTVKTDHCSLRWLLQQESITGQRLRWLAVLNEFDITEIQHLPGASNVVADNLSRYPDPAGPSYDIALRQYGNMDIRFSSLQQLQAFNLVRSISDHDQDGDSLLAKQVSSPDPSSHKEDDNVLPTPKALFGTQPNTPMEPSGLSIREDPVENRRQQNLDEGEDISTEDLATPSVADVPLTAPLESDPLLGGYEYLSSVSAPEDTADFISGYDSCADFAKVYQTLTQKGTDPTFPQYRITDDKLLVFHDGIRERVCVPTSQRNFVLKTLHDIPLGGHTGFKKLHALLGRRFFFPGMAERTKQYVLSCEHCQRNKSYNSNTRGIPTPTPIPVSRFSVVALDLLSGFPTSRRGNDCIVVFTDRLTKRAWIEPVTKDITARGLAEIMLRTVFSSQGMPSILLSDQGPQFTSAFWQEFFALLKTDVKLTSSYHPQSNGQTEKFNKTLIEGLRSFVSARQDDWEDYLIYLQFAYNNSVHAQTGFTPFQLTLGQHPRSPLDALISASQGGADVFIDENDLVEPDGSTKSLAEALSSEVISNLLQARDKLQEAAHAFRLRHANACKPHSFKVGHQVLMSSENLKLKLPCRKLSPRFVGPFTITELKGTNAVRLELTGRFSLVRDIVNIEYLRPYRLRPEKIGPPPSRLDLKPIDVEPGFEWYDIEEIIGHQGRPGHKQKFLVRWKDCDASMDSWVEKPGITSEALMAYERFLRTHAEDPSPNGREARVKALRNVVGPNNQFSEIARVEKAARARSMRAQNSPTPSSSSSDVPIVTGVSRGGRRLMQASRFKV